MHGCQHIGCDTACALYPQPRPLAACAHELNWTGLADGRQTNRTSASRLLPCCSFSAVVDALEFDRLDNKLKASKAHREAAATILHHFHQ